MSFKDELFSVSNEKYHKIITIFGLRFKYFSNKLFIKNIEKQLQAQYNILNLVTSPSSLPTAKGNLREGQLFSIKLLKEIKQLCKENNINFWLDFGTLLGAIRHKGFIPWDSDIDISMLREDYIKIIPLLKEKYDGTDIEIREYGYTNHFQLRIQPKVDDTYGVDIFAIDKFNMKYSDIDSIKDINKRIKTSALKLKRKCKINKSFAKNIKEVRNYIYRLTNEHILSKKTIPTKTPALFFAIDYPFVDPKNFVIPYERLFPLGSIEFEGEEYNCPNNYIEYIENYYGKNFMFFPSKFKSGEDKIDDYIESLRKE